MQPAVKLEGLDRRQHERAGVKTFVHLGSESNFYTGLTNDVSEGGLFVATHEVVARGVVVDLEFSLGDNDYKIKVQGEVRWVREYNRDSPEVHPGMGVQFLNLSDEDRTAIRKFVKTRDALYYDD